MFKIYNASAGSGKTYSLVKDYLILLFKSRDFLPHRSILAITFTNRAVDEMKQRILESLIRFSDPKIIKSKDKLFSDLVNELAISPTHVCQKAKILIQKILHNYGGFEVCTIDKFNQKILRTFAYDLNLPSNFEVELESDLLLKSSVDSLIQKIGKDRNLTRTLVDYALSKTNDDKTWDISIDLYKSAKLLLHEDSVPYLNSFFDLKHESFNDFKRKLDEEFSGLEQQIVNISKGILSDISTAGIVHSDFNRSSIPKYFEKTILLGHRMSFNSVWQKDIEGYSFYTKNVTEKVKNSIESLKPQIINAFIATKRGVYRLKYIKNIINNLTPNSVLALINKELNEIKSHQNIVLISEFNRIISSEIKSQPAPFIYERLGEKFDHFFIDEFQDTSKLQWENMIPLIKNNLASPGNTVLLAGDPKQAIYRWRGGHPDQFIDIINRNKTFSNKPNIHTLPLNYRSSMEIVKFNNSFFEFISKNFFSNQQHKQVYSYSKQSANRKSQGLVQLSFLDFNSNSDKTTAYADKVFKIINSITSSSDEINYQDICVLVRKQKEGVVIAKHLIEKGIPIISSQSLLISSSKEVLCIISLYKYIINPDDQISQLFLINYLIDKHQISQAHKFREECLSKTPDEFLKSLTSLNIKIGITDILSRSPYEATEAVIRSFRLVDSSNSYVQLFLDFVFEFSQKHIASLSSLIEYFDSKKDSLSITSPEGVNAIRIMTIHKAKGLEFPIVIFPFADLDIYREIEPKEWVSSSHINPQFPHLLMNFNKDFEHFGEEARQIFFKHQSQLELDNVNLLYVALTRAADQLYIIGRNTTDLVLDKPAKTYSDLFIKFLFSIGKWNQGVFEYSFGSAISFEPKNKPLFETIKPKRFFSNTQQNLEISIKPNKSLEIKNSNKEALEKGNLIHAMLAKVYSYKDVDRVVKNFFDRGLVSSYGSKEIKSVIYSIVSHPRLTFFFKGDIEIYNEREILTKNNQIIIPDRLILQKDKSAVIIDYKTGGKSKSHEDQLDHYSSVVNSLGYRIDKKILIYIYPQIDVKVYK